MFTIVFSPINNAYFILFGTGPVPTRSVLAVCDTRRDAQDLLDSWGR